ncbi:hypothetical protein [Microbacterium sp.]|uniref:hypothetical protein n=1 Tax=Microbacterium sp. TaxID=51671 RepID=UPI003A871B8B
MSADALPVARRQAVPETPPPPRRFRALDRPRPARRPRVLYGIIAVAGACAIGAAQLGLSILTTQGSYELAALTGQQRELSQQRQVLEDSVVGLSSPQYLAANASALGMVTGQEPNYLRLSDGQIIGTGQPASGSTSVHALRDAAVANALVSGTSLATDPDATLDTGATVELGSVANTPTPPPIADGLPTPTTH